MAPGGGPEVRVAVVGREVLFCVADLYLDSDSNTPIGGVPRGDRPSALSVLLREGGRCEFDEGAGDLELK